MALGHRDRVSIPWFIHRALVNQFVLESEVEPGVFLWRRATAGYQNIIGSESQRRRALIELGLVLLYELFYCPFVFVDIVA